MTAVAPEKVVEINRRAGVSANGNRPPVRPDGMNDRDWVKAQLIYADGRYEAAPVTAASLGIVPIDWPTFWTQERPEEDWTLSPIVPRGRQVAFYADPKLGKSLLALDGCAAASTGRSVFGQEPGPVIDIVYIDMEMTEDDVFERLSDLGYGPADDLSHFHYYLLQNLPPLDQAEGGEVLEEIVLADQASLVVLDTVARVVSGPESDADTIRAFYRHTGRRLKQAGVGLWRLDHVGHDKSHQRGTSAKNDDVDIIFKATLVDGKVVLHRTHTRIPWVPASATFTREEEPYLRHVLGPEAWPAGTKDTAELLDRLDVLSDATAATAMKALRAKGLGKRRTVVLAALKYRKMASRTTRP
jgi:hypothetical protein